MAELMEEDEDGADEEADMGEGPSSGDLAPE